MTNAEYVAKIRELVESRTKRGARTKEQALAQLVEEGIATRDGKLTPEYGGTQVSQRKTRKAA